MQGLSEEQGLNGEAPPIVATRDLVRRFGGLSAVNGLSLTLRRGEMVGLIGPNGAGKTTLFNLIAGTLAPSEGSILIDGRDVSRQGSERRIGLGVGRTFQIPRPFPEMTVLENVLTGRQEQAGEKIWMNFLRPGKVAAEERQAVDKARSLLEFLALSRLELAPARALSGGQRKLLELARVLMADPAAILLDEPAAGVNPALLELIIEKVNALNARGAAILLIEHNMDMVARLCRRVIVMAAGQILAEGGRAEVAAEPAVIAAYLGATA
ncbi:MAG TPA: ABC transporter ATP-binding protein [Roseiarcus sp.]|nr:ABC transporter ATP-binding protein [Roseiarcus sp.]